ncbi:MAG: hypothetical protein KC468_14110, partial [Myxococcales bacterium]|nr:hypothetical protein [Myxococcales bacterium]
MTISAAAIESVARPFGPDIWTVEGDPVRLLTIPFTTRMTIVRLPGGGLWMHSPVAPARARALAIGALVLAGCGDSSRESATDAATTNDTLTSGGPTTGPSSATDDVTESTTGTNPTMTGTSASSTGTSETGATETTTDDPSTTAIDPSTSSGTTDGGCQQGEIICEDGEAKVCDGMG